MQLILRFIIFFSALQIAFSQSTTTVYGKISNFTDTKVYIRYYRDLVTYERVFADSAQLDKDGSFSMKFKWNRPFQAEFINGHESARMFIGVNDSLKIELNAKQFDESIKYSGNGAEVNNYLAQKELKFPRFIDPGKYALQEKEFTLFIDSLCNAELDFLNNYFSTIRNKSSAMNTFINEEEAEIKYFRLTTKMNYPNLFSYNNKLKEPMVLSNSYYDFLKQVTLVNPKAIHSISYLLFVENYMEKEVAKLYKLDTTQNSIELKEKFIDTNLTGEIKSYTLAKWAYGLLWRNSDLKNGKRLVEKYKSNSSEQEYAAILDEALNNASRLAVGNPAPAFKFLDNHGKEVSLTDFRGKVVYLDIWASWCAPCRIQIPFAKKLEEQFKDKDVVFLYISIDENEEEWKKLIEEKELGGIHLISKGTHNSEVSKLYNVKGVPRYFIIDKQGKIADNNAKRPNGDVQKDLEALLK
jgi:peroxiredoxin